METNLFSVMRRLCLALALATGAGLAALTSAPAHAQMRGLPDFTNLVEQVGPSVVNIRTSESVPRQTPRQNRPQPQEEGQPRGVGSGFILSADGLIMTNAHVVEGANEVLVTLTDKREFKARIIGSDQRSDVAIVKIEATRLPAVKVGDVNRLRVGEWVMAIGSPFGLENTVTAGIVSAKQRDTGDDLLFIQTDVAINPGNSGGPLINMRGEVIGINSQIYSRSGGFMGISFAIPIDEAVRVSDQLRSTGKVSRGLIGVDIESVSKELADLIGLGKPVGAIVTGVYSGTPAHKAGIRGGDVIVKFDGKVIETSSELRRIVGSTKPGTKSTVTVFRQGTLSELSLVVGELSDRPALGRAPSQDEKPKPSALAQSFGFIVSDLTEAHKSELDVKGGVRLESVGEAAARAGLNAGDVILAVSNIEVLNVKDFDAALEKIDRTKAFSVLFRRGDRTGYAAVRPPR